MKHRVVVGVTVIMCTMFFISCSSSESLKTFIKETTPYTKEDYSEYTYKINADNIIMNNSCSDLNITKSDSNEIKISMKKSVGGKEEENLQEALDNIKCTLEDNILKIGPEKDDKSLINSKNVETTISIPRSITSLELKSSVGDIKLEGDYSSLKANVEVGGLSYKGDLKQGNISSNVGDINLNLQHLDSSNKFNINGKVGDVDIVVPKESSINLTGSKVKDVKLGKGISSNSDGPTFDINKTVGDIRIDS